jgi:Zn-dependent peptidase ImmA (M78 family)
VKLCNNFNIEIYDSNLDSNVSGAIYHDNNIWEVFVNESHHPNRQRFTIAHEFGHYVSYVNNSYSKTYLDTQGNVTDVMYRKQECNSEEEKMEQEANLIAARLLMKEDIMNKLIRENREISDIAKQLRISVEAVSYRIKSFGYSIL